MTACLFLLSFDYLFCFVLQRRLTFQVGGGGGEFMNNAASLLKA